MTEISEYSLLLCYETKTSRHQSFRALSFPPNKEKMNTWQMNTGQPKKHCQENVFPAPQSDVTFYTFSYSQPEWNQNHLKWWVWGCLCTHPWQEWQPSSILGRADRGSSRSKCAFYESDQALDPVFFLSSTSDYFNYWL